MRRTIIVVAATVAALLVPGAALAAPPPNPDGWGAAVSTFNEVTEPGTLGEHSASFPTPRTGVGNLADDPALNDLDSGHVGGHGCFVLRASRITSDCESVQPGRGQ